MKEGGCSQTRSSRRYWKFSLPMVIYSEIQGPHCSRLSRAGAAAVSCNGVWIVRVWGEGHRKGISMPVKMDLAFVTMQQLTEFV